MSDLVYDGEEPASVGRVIADSIRAVYEYPGTFADALAPHAARLGLRRGDGLGSSITELRKSDVRLALVEPDYG